MLSFREGPGVTSGIVFLSFLTPYFTLDFPPELSLPGSQCAVQHTRYYPLLYLLTLDDSIHLDEGHLLASRSCSPPNGPNGSHPLDQRHISTGDLPHKPHIRSMEHDMKMLNRMNGLERLPIPKPDHLFGRHSPERAPYIAFYGCP